MSIYKTIGRSATVAIFHLSIKVFSRGNGGKSAVSAAAYRAAEKIFCEYDGRMNDYTRKLGVVHKEIILPEHAPAEYKDRAVLWNAVEKVEKAKNSQLAREIEIALPMELTREQNISLARDFVKCTFVDKGMCADVCIHDTNGENPHAHIMLTMRPFNEDSTWGDKQKKEYILDKYGEKIYDKKKKTYKCKTVKTTDWNDQTKADEWRAAWEESLNRYLEKYNHPARVNHLSYEKQGVEQVPTIHLGVAAFQMEKRGISTERGDINRAIAITNKQLGQLRARIKKLKDWVYSQPLQDAPSMGDMMSAINGGQNLKSRWKRIADLKTAAKVLIFLQENSITSMEQLANKITVIHQKRYDLANTIKAQERRISTLDRHLAQVDIHKQHMAVYKKYKQLDPKKRGAYKEKHADEISQYESALTYLKDHLNGRTAIPEKEWRTERDKLLTERYEHCDEYYKLREDIRSVEVLRRGAEKMINEITPERKPTQKRDITI